MRVLAVLAFSIRSIARLSPAAPRRVSRAIAFAAINRRRSRRKGMADMRGREPQAVSENLQIAEGLLNREPTAVETDRQ